MNRFIVLFQKLRNIGIAYKKSELFLLYIRLLVTYFITKSLRLKKKQERLFGRTFYFFHYSSFLSMFEELFIQEEYYFKSKNQRPVIIDCGTNIGLEIIYYKMLYPNCRVICFEPDKQTFRLLIKNINSNNITGVTAYNYALSDKKGVTSFYIDRRDRGSFIMSTKKERGLKDRVIVKAVLLSSYITEQIDFIKIDIEGAEDDVVRDLVKRRKLKYIRQIIIEYHHHMSKRTDNFSKFLDTLEKNGFGYQISSKLRPPFMKQIFEDILIFAYKK